MFNPWDLIPLGSPRVPPQEVGLLPPALSVQVYRHCLLVIFFGGPRLLAPRLGSAWVVCVAGGWLQLHRVARNPPNEGASSCTLRSAAAGVPGVLPPVALRLSHALTYLSVGP